MDLVGDARRAGQADHLQAVVGVRRGDGTRLRDRTAAESLPGRHRPRHVAGHQAAGRQEHQLPALLARAPDGADLGADGVGELIERRAGQGGEVGLRWDKLSAG